MTAEAGHLWQGFSLRWEEFRLIAAQLDVGAVSLRTEADAVDLDTTRPEGAAQLDDTRPRKGEVANPDGIAQLEGRGGCSSSSPCSNLRGRGSPRLAPENLPQLILQDRVQRCRQPVTRVPPGLHQGESQRAGRRGRCSLVGGDVAPGVQFSEVSQACWVARGGRLGHGARRGPRCRAGGGRRRRRPRCPARGLPWADDLGRRAGGPGSSPSVHLRPPVLAPRDHPHPGPDRGRRRRPPAGRGHLRGTALRGPSQSWLDRLVQARRAGHPGDGAPGWSAEFCEGLLAMMSEGNGSSLLVTAHWARELPLSTEPVPPVEVRLRDEDFAHIGALAHGRRLPLPTLEETVLRRADT
jgi:hypothetical protein